MNGRKNQKEISTEDQSLIEHYRLALETSEQRIEQLENHLSHRLGVLLIESGKRPWLIPLLPYRIFTTTRSWRRERAERGRGSHDEVEKILSDLKQKDRKILSKKKAKRF